MPLPIAPIASFALRYGAMALTAYALARKVEQGRRDQKVEDVLDGVEEGAALRRDEEQMSFRGRIRRVVRFGNGPGIEIDAASLARVRWRKVG